MYATFSVPSNAHKQTVTCDNFFCHIETGVPVFQQMNLSHKIRVNFLMYTGK